MVSPRKSRKKSLCFSRTVTSWPSRGEEIAEHHAGGASAYDAAGGFGCGLA